MNIDCSADPEPTAIPSIDACRFLQNASLFEQPRRFRLGCTFDPVGIDLAGVAVHRLLGRTGLGWWECELPGDALSWTTGVYDIFGLPLASRVTRTEAVSFYAESSRAIMERLRSTAISRNCGFVLDAEIRPANRVQPQWMRIVGVPVTDGATTVSLTGLKLII